MASFCAGRKHPSFLFRVILRRTDSGLTIVLYTNVAGGLQSQGVKGGIDWAQPKSSGSRLPRTLDNTPPTLEVDPDFEFMVEGHTDDVPYRKGVLLDNWDLSVKRSTADFGKS